MTMKSHAWAPLLLPLLAACDKPSAPAAPASAAPSAAAAAPASKLDAPGNDPAIVAAVRAVIAGCEPKWRPAYGYENDCDAYKQWSALKVTSDARDATLVNLIEDGSERVRNLGVRGLVAWGGGYRSDQALATRVVAAAAKETSEAFAGILGFEVGQIEAAKTGLGEPIKGLALDEKGSTDLRTGIVSIFLPSNKDNELAFGLTREIAEKGGAVRLRTAAIAALSAAYDKRSAEVCKAWTAALTAGEEPIAAAAASRLTTGASWVGYSGNGWFSTSSYSVPENRCGASVDAALAAIEKRQADDRLKEEAWVVALKGALRPDLTATPPAQRRKARALARSIVEKKENGAAVRGAALHLVADEDPDAKAFAARFTGDADVHVKTIAAAIAGR
jgi:hypothetical protein